MDKNLAIGAKQVLENDVVQAIGSNKNIRSIVYGLGGRDVFVKDIVAMVS